MTGGKREGAGRPPEKDPATKLVTIKMTPKQHAKFLELGGSRWVKRMLESMSASEVSKSEGTEAKMQTRLAANPHG